MRLLISVRSAEEAAAAIRGGADIIDAKEPERGSLGPVGPEALRSIAAEVPENFELSVAMGDYSSAAQVINAIAALPISSRPRPLYLKLGFAGTESGAQIFEMLATARVIAQKHPAAPRIIAVAYADAGLAGTAEPATVIRAAGLAGSDGVLLDTREKGGANLLDWISPVALEQLIGLAREHRLLSAAAGSLQREDLELVAEGRPDIVGFRSAACRGGRAGRVSSMLVRDLRARLDQVDSGFLQGSKSGSGRLRETPDAGAKLCGLN
jgi:uncharacterized protein (UPF0264 family)